MFWTGAGNVPNSTVTVPLCADNMHWDIIWTDDHTGPPVIVEPGQIPTCKKCAVHYDALMEKR